MCHRGREKDVAIGEGGGGGGGFRDYNGSKMRQTDTVTKNLKRLC